MKFLLVIGVVAFVLWLMLGRGRRVEGPASRAAKPVAGPAAMVACAHCGVHVPKADAPHDAEGRAYCGEAHRVAGPR